MAADDVLDLSGADTSGFDPIPSNRYLVRIHKVEMDQTKNAGKMPAGTPMVKIQLVVDEGEFEDRYVFDQFVLPPADYEKRDKMLGFFVRFLVAFGLDEAKVKSKGFKLDSLGDLVGQKAVATVAFKKGEGQYQDSNDVKGYKPADTWNGGASSSGSGLI